MEDLKLDSNHHIVYIIHYQIRKLSFISFYKIVDYLYLVEYVYKVYPSTDKSKASKNFSFNSFFTMEFDLKIVVKKNTYTRMKIKRKEH